MRQLYCLIVGWACFAAAMVSTSATSLGRTIRCDGSYRHHLQGVCLDDDGAIFWSFTSKLVKSEPNGKVVKSIEVPNHHGDLCYWQGRIYVAVNLGEFNKPEGSADSWIYVYDATGLELLQRHRVPEVVHGAGGIGVRDGKFLVVGGLPETETVNYVYQYDADFKFRARHVLKSGHTQLGIQTATFADDHWWFGCYGSPKILLRCDAHLERVERFEFDCSLGIVPTAGGRFLIARGGRTSGGNHTGELVAARPEHQRGLALADAPDFDIQLETVFRGYDGKTCWVHPRVGIIPGEHPTAVMTMLKLTVTGSDLFSPTWDTFSTDNGTTWSPPIEQTSALGHRSEPDDVTYGVCDFTPQWHAASKRLLAIGQTVRYKAGKVIKNRARETAYAVYDAEKKSWSRWQTLEMPDEARFHSCGAGSVQRVDLPDGTILLPVYYTSPGKEDYSVSVLRCSFDGTKLRLLEIGNELAVEGNRGFAEPSLTTFAGRWFLTLRNNAAGYVTTSGDGVHFDEPRKWTFDDGTELGNYNTQQHWVSHGHGLFLVYTRKGANNDHVFRHRAPLFIAQVDPEKLQVIRATERTLIAERGARLGNFGVTVVSPKETWITVAEWMQTWPPKTIIPVDNPRGADNSVYLARILWHD